MFIKKENMKKVSDCSKAEARYTDTKAEPPYYLCMNCSCPCKPMRFLTKDEFYPKGTCHNCFGHGCAHCKSPERKEGEE